MNLEEKQQIILNYFKIGNYKEALIRSKVILRENPNNPNIHNMVGMAHLQMGNIENSIQYHPIWVDHSNFYNFSRVHV